MGLREDRIRNAALLFEFYRCPDSRKVIEALPGDDKAICRFCGGTHRTAGLVPATAHAWVQQEEERRRGA
jgi:hypothetical protein